MDTNVLKKEKYLDLDELLNEVIIEKAQSGEREDVVLEYLCQTMTGAENYDVLSERAQKGDAYAYFQLANWYIIHAQSTADYCKAYRHAKTAVKGGINEAYYILGQLHLYGSGCNKKLITARKYFRRFLDSTSREDQINDNAIIDTYIKLADIEKELGHYSRVKEYYAKLESIDPKFGELKEVFSNDTKRNMREHINVIIFSIFNLIVVGLIAVVVGKNVSDEAISEFQKYVIGQKAVREEYNGSTLLVPERKVKIAEPVSYKAVTEAEFNALNLEEIELVDVYASSEYISQKGIYYGALNLVDHDSSTQWQEGAADSGIDQSIVFCFKAPVIVSGMKIQNGKQVSFEGFYENNRLASFEIFGKDGVVVEIPDDMNMDYIVFENPIMSDKVEVVIKSVFNGSKFNDTCVSEMMFFE